ncbi:MAG: PAS domain S-box protein [Chloroflexota bacterium]|nr:PAS domain S-box protein [Chloroflexota bacterium]
MPTKAELQKQVAELEAAQAKAEMMNQISRGLNAAADEDALLNVLVQPAVEYGMAEMVLFYTELGETGEPEWMVKVAAWQREGELRSPIGTRYNLSAMPLMDMVFSSPGEALLISDTYTDERMTENTQALMKHLGTRATILAPLVHVGRWVGFVNVHWDEPHEFSAEEVELYDAFASLVPAAVASRRLLVEKERAVVETLYTISRGLNTAHDEDELLQILSLPAQNAGATRAELLYLNLDQAGEPEWGEVVAIWQREGALPVSAGTRYHLPEFPFARLILSNQDEPLLIADTATDEWTSDQNISSLLDKMGVRAMAIIPLSQAGRWVGILILHWDEPHEFSAQEMEIYDALIGLASPPVAIRRLVDSLEHLIEERTGELAVFEAMVEGSKDGILTADMEGRITYANQVYHEMHGYDHEHQEMVGLHANNLRPPEDVTFFAEKVMPQVFSGGWSGEIREMRKDGTVYDVSASAFPLRDAEGRPTSLVVSVRDITGRKQMEAEREQLQQEVIEAQRRTLQELSTPIIPVMERIIVMPLVGSIDTMRARDITRSLLAGIREQRAKVVILDITGVPLVDSGVANHLNKTIQAARLKGARTIVTGISDAVAETIVDLGIDWSGIETLSDLQTGLVVALGSLGIKLTR